MAGRRVSAPPSPHTPQTLTFIWWQSQISHFYRVNILMRLFRVRAVRVGSQGLHRSPGTMYLPNHRSFAGKSWALPWVVQAPGITAASSDPDSWCCRLFH